MDAFEVFQEFSSDLAFRFRADAVDQIEQEVHQGIGEFATAEMAKRRLEGHPQRIVMAAEFVGRFHGGTVAVGLHHFRCDGAKEVGGQRNGTDPLQLVNLTEEVLKCRTARIGTEFVKKGTTSGNGRLISTNGRLISTGPRGSEG